MSATAGIGHNQPRPMSPEDVEAFLKETCADLVARRDEILAGIERFKAAYPVIPDAEVQAKAADFASAKGAIGGFLKLAEARRVTEKQPFDAASGAVQGFFKTLVGAITEGQTEIKTRMTAFATKLEAERRAAAQKEAEAAAERARQAEAEAMASMAPSALEQAAEHYKAAERAQVLAEAKAAEHSRVTGTQSGATVSLRTSYKLNEEASSLTGLARAVVAEHIASDLAALSKRLPQEAARGIAEAIKHLQSYGTAPLEYLAFNTVRIGYAIRSEGVRAIPGCQIDEIRSV